MALFKGELSLNDILSMPKKILLDLKDARVNRLMDEQKSLERERRRDEQVALQNQILQK